MKRLSILLLLVCTVLTAGAFELGPNQYILGNSTSDSYDNYGSVPFTGDVLVGAILYNDNYEHLRNCRALGIRFCVPEVVEVKCVTLHDSDLEPIKQQKPSKPIEKGWNYVEFDTPQQLDPVGTFISYTYVQTKDNYGICNWPNTAPGGFWTYLYNTQANKWMWSNFSNQLGAVCIQLVVEADPLPDYNVSITDIAPNPAAINQKATGVVYMASNSSKEVSSIDYTLTIDGQASSYHRTFSKAIPTGPNQEFGVEFEYPMPAAAGNYTSTFTLTAINGETPVDPVSMEFSQKVLTRIVQRHTVIEEFTGTGCGNCPRGWAGMEYLKEHYADRFIGIAVHQYNQGDPMYCARYCNPGFAGAPTCVIDRYQTLDPYFGSTQQGIDVDLRNYASQAPDVDIVNLTATYNEDKTKVAVKTDVEFLTDCGKYTIAYVLTADGLSGSTNAWNQTNYYNSKTTAEAGVLPHIPDLAKFCTGGEWASKASLVYNDVLIGSSYSTTGTNGAVGFSSKNAAGSVASKSYNIAMPTSKTVLGALDYDKVYAIVLVIDTDKHIANAARVQVSSPEGIGTVLAPSTSTGATYDLSGRSNSKSQRGISIVNGKKIIK